jgi:hypothetical protein
VIWKAIPKYERDDKGGERVTSLPRITAPPLELGMIRTFKNPDGAIRSDELAATVRQQIIERKMKWPSSFSVDGKIAEIDWSSLKVEVDSIGNARAALEMKADGRQADVMYAPTTEGESITLHPYVRIKEPEPIQRPHSPVPPNP